jgi:antitoxin CptB
MSDDREARRLRWLCRRGMKELDVLLEAFLASGYDDLSAAQAGEFRALLELEDPELHAVLLDRLPPPPGVGRGLVERLQRFQSAG